MASKYDLVVIGAGPAGLLAAKAAAENGLDVAVLEKKSDPGQLGRACGQTLVSMNEYYLGELVGYSAREKRVTFPSYGFSFKYDGPAEDLHAVHSYAPNGHRMTLGDVVEQRKKGAGGKVAMTFDKEVMLRCLLDDLKASRVDVFGGVAADRVVSSNEKAIVEGAGKSFEAAYVIVADGVNSRVVHNLGLNEKRTYYCNLYGLGYYLDGVEPPFRDVVARIPAYFKEGAASLFLLPRPGTDQFNALIITVDPRVDMAAAMDYFIEKSYWAPWFKKPRKLRTFSAVCSCYSPVLEPCLGRVLIAGDAASTQELENQGAMIAGWKAGNAVSLAVQERGFGIEVKGVSDYANWWKAEFLGKYKAEDYVKSFAMPYILRTEEDVNYFSGLMNDILPPSYNPYSSPGAAALKKVIPVLQRDRPDILQKLQRRGAPALELYAEVRAISKPVVS